MSEAPHVLASGTIMVPTRHRVEVLPGTSGFLVHVNDQFIGLMPPPGYPEADGLMNKVQAELRQVMGDAGRLRTALVEQGWTEGGV